MKAIQPFSAKYESPLKYSVGSQAIVILVGAFLSGDGVLPSRCAVELAAFWVGTLLILFRRPRTPTPFDLEFIRFGFFILFVLSLWLVPAVMEWRGL
jgi:hypothetical protein